MNRRKGRAAALRRLLDEPGQDMIVIPFYAQYAGMLWDFVPVRTDRGLMFIARNHFRLGAYQPGVCIQ